MERVIASISTPLGKGAISIVRMSGKGCLNVAEKVFVSKNIDYKKITPKMLYLGNFCFADKSQEKCFMVYFRSPASYTGEDMVEFQVHGGMLLTQKILNTLLDNGAVLAEPGEYSKLAFENGKISLDEAEAIIGEINAESEGELKASLAVADGQLKTKINNLQNNLTEVIAEIEATLDYPEEDFEKSAKEKFFKTIEKVKTEVDEFIEESKNARYLSKGISVAIVGSPNVGKSSILNALIGEEKAIVTDIAGTTRDIVNEQIFYKGIKLNFIDTAGIRDASDVIEKIGIEKSKKAIDNADITLFVLDGARQMSEDDKQIYELVKKSNHLIVVNKSDKERKLNKFENEIEVSALQNKGINNLKENIYNNLISKEIDFDKTIIINERQIAILNECENIIESILLSKEQSMDIIAMQIKSLWNSLGKITGQCENESIIDLIFSKFCLGK